MAERLAAALLIIASVGGIFFQVHDHGFIPPVDRATVLDNPMLLDGLSAAGVARAFAQPHEHSWVPLTWISLQIDHALYGREAAGYLLTNAALHTLSALLLFVLLLRTTGALYCAAFCALVFAVHPLHVESVAWISRRKDVLSGLLFMLTLLAYARHAAGPPRLSRWLLVALLMAAGLLASPMLVTTPFVLLLLDLWPLGRMGTDGRVEVARLRGLVLEKLPLLLMALAVCVVTVRVHQGAVPSLEHQPLAARVAVSLSSYLAYLSQSVLPQGLIVPYASQASVEAIDWSVPGSAALLLLGATVVAATSRRERPYLLVGWLWFVGMLLPVIGLVQIGEVTHADRYMYLPQIGLTLTMAWGAANVVERTPAARSAFAVVGGLVIVWFGGLAWRQTALWSDPITLYGHAVAADPRDDLAQVRLADTLLEQGRVVEAAIHYQEANALHARWMQAELGLADVAAALGRFDQAILLYQHWVQLAPHQVRPVASLGRALLRSGRFEQALASFESGLRLDPEVPALYAGRAEALDRLGRWDAAVAAYDEALRRDPGLSGVANNLAWILAVSPDPALRDPPRAIRLAESAVAGNPGDPARLDTLAAAYAAAGRFDDAIRTGKRAVELAERIGAAPVAEQAQQRLSLYEKGRPYRED